MCTAAAQISAFNQRPHAPRNMAELAVVTGGQLKAFFFGQSHQSLGFARVHRKRLLDVHVTAALQTKSGNLEVTLRRCRDVHNVRPGFAQQFRQLGEVAV